MNVIKIEEDKVFLTDQRSERKYVMGGVDTELAEREKRKGARSQKEIQRRLREEDRKQKVSCIENLQPVLLTSSSISSESDLTESEEEFTPKPFKIPVEDQSQTTFKIQPKRAKFTAQDIIPPNLASALDRTNVSDRKAAYILNAAAQAYGLEDVSKMPLSFSSIRRSRMKSRSQLSSSLKANFSAHGPLIIHVDGKILPALCGGPEKEDRVALVVSGKEGEKLLAIPKVAKGSGDLVAEAAATAINDWKLKEEIVGISFDTTASNTGRLNGSCVLLEKKLEKKLLWLACRHHVHEVLIGYVFNAAFGPTSGPNVSLFRRFKEYWPQIDPQVYAPCNDSRLGTELEILKMETVNFALDILNGQAGHLPREDYRELLELVLIFLGETPPRGVRFRVPGAFHHARWMSKLIYVLKIFLFQNQFKLTKRESVGCLDFGLFVSLIYAKAWITCSNSCDAPFNDLSLIQSLAKYNTISKVISTTALKAISRHLWYLGEEMVPLSLFSDVVPVETKRLMVARLQETLGQQELDCRSIRCTVTQDLSIKTLDSFIGPCSGFFFDALQLDTSFFEEDVENWPLIESYQNAKKTVQAMKVVNDCAERAIALATTFNSSLTKHDEQKQFLFQTVESHRKRFPNPTKQTILRDSE